MRFVRATSSVEIRYTKRASAHEFDDLAGNIYVLLYTYFFPTHQPPTSTITQQLAYRILQGQKHGPSSVVHHLTHEAYWNYAQFSVAP